ncbi:hypothetical protein Tco_0778930 [Tanacetum coccineum]
MRGASCGTKGDRIVDRLSDVCSRAGPADFDVIVRMDWLSKRKFVIVCHEKVVRIPLEGGEILRVHGERTLGAAKALMNAKVDEPRISDIPVVRDFIDVFPKELSMTPQRQVEFRIGLVHGATPVAKSPYRLAPIELTHCILANLNSTFKLGFYPPKHDLNLTCIYCFDNFSCNQYLTNFQNSKSFEARLFEK